MSVDTLTREARDAFAGYAEPDDRPPFRTLAALTAVFNAGFAGALFAAKRSDRLPASVTAQDVVLICPYCLGLWASGAFHAGLMLAPRVTRVAASTLTALTLSDFLQIAYKAAEDRGLGGA